MIFTSHYCSPIGDILLASKDHQLIGLWIKGQKYDLGMSYEFHEKNDEKILIQAKEWLTKYFNGQKPQITDLPLAPIGSEFRQRVWHILCQIPYGEVTTYGAIAKSLAKQTGKSSMSAQAVGNAVGHNPISIIIPCHRVIGANGNLTGYAAGIDKKIQLLQLEKVDMKNFSVPKKGTS